jgi:hypothetical protein
MELNTQNEVQNAIGKEVHQSRYHLAEEAPICQGEPRGKLGYKAKSLAAQSVLNGTFCFTDSFDHATQRLCNSIAHFPNIIPQDFVDRIISCEIWQQRRRRKREDTSSSVSTLHFGHYITGADNDHIFDFCALKTSLALVHGISLNR